MPVDFNSLYGQIRKRLIESGEWDYIRSIMQAKLNEAGWVDETHHKSKESARKMDPLSFQLLLEETTPGPAKASIPLSVKKEISNLIRQHLEKHLE